MSDEARIRVDVPLGKPLIEIETDIIRQAILLCEGNKHRAARRLDLGIGKVNRALKRLGRLSNLHGHPTGAGADASDPLPLGGQKEVGS
jgi:DNA-binding NtrC family response regulator